MGLPLRKKKNFWGLFSNLLKKFRLLKGEEGVGTAIKKELFLRLPTGLILKIFAYKGCIQRALPLQSINENNFILWFRSRIFDTNSTSPPSPFNQTHIMNIWVWFVCLLHPLIFVLSLNFNCKIGMPFFYLSYESLKLHIRSRFNRLLPPQSLPLPTCFLASYILVHFA